MTKQINSKGVSTTVLLPDEPNVKATITVTLTFEIEFKNNSFNSNFNFDGKSVAIAVGITGIILAVFFLISTGGVGGVVAEFSSLIVSGQALIH